MRPSRFVASVLLLASAANAWPWGPTNNLERDLAPMIMGRDDPTSSESQSSAASSSDSKSSSDSASDSASDSSSASATGSASKSASGSGSSITGSAKSSSSKGKSTSYDTTKTYDARLPAGGIQMVTPAPNGPATYYKIKQPITFAWNYTSLSATPSAIDILASCSTNAQMYTIASNYTITNSTQSIVWDTGAYETNASAVLLTADYTLIIHDAAKDISATAQAGYLGTFDQFVFGMYQPQPKVDFKDFVCVTCNGALSSAERQALTVVFGTAALCVVSFGWFTGVVGLW